MGTKRFKYSLTVQIYAARWFPYPGTGPGTGNPKAQYGDVTQWLDLSALYGNPLKPQKLFAIFEMTPWLTVDPVTHKLMNDGKLVEDKPNDFDIGYASRNYINGGTGPSL